MPRLEEAQANLLCAIEKMTTYGTLSIVVARVDQAAWGERYTRSSITKARTPESEPPLHQHQGAGTMHLPHVSDCGQADGVFFTSLPSESSILITRSGQALAPR